MNYLPLYKMGAYAGLQLAGATEAGGGCLAAEAAGQTVCAAAASCWCVKGGANWHWPDWTPLEWLQWLHVLPRAEEGCCCCCVPC